MKTVFVSSLMVMACLSPRATAAETPPDAPETDHQALEQVEVAPDKELAPYRRELLELAYTAVSKMPLNPHVKNRARAQQSVVEAALDLGQSAMALEFSRRIPNWRRTMGYALYAQHAADRQFTEGLDALLKRAVLVSTEEASQGWQRQRVRAAVGVARIKLGQVERAETLAEGIDERSETGTVELAKLEEAEEATFQARFDQMAEFVKDKNFSANMKGVEGLWDLYEAYYENEEQREKIETLIQASNAKMPGNFGVESFLRMAEAALKHGNAEHAIELADRLLAFFNERTIKPYYELPPRFRLGPIYHKAGETEKAYEVMKQAMRQYEAEREQIISIHRASVVRTAAECYVEMGDAQKAMATYKQAVEEGVVNPNSRPRSIDLSETCISLALHDFKPDDTLFARLREINEQLGIPW